MKQIKMKKIGLLLSILLCTVACENDETATFKGAAVEQYSRAKAQKIVSVSKKAEREITPQDQNSQLDRKRIKTGSISFETRDLLATRNTVLAVLKKYEGYLVRDNQYTSHDRISANLSIRVPAQNFDLFLGGISEGVKTFDTKNVQVSDVTEQFLDAQSRLKTKQALERTYLTVLKKARTVREILDVERELSKVRGAIEASQGKLQYLKSQVAFSTLNIMFYKKVKVSELGFAVTVKEAFTEGFTKVKVFLIGIISFWPFIIIGLVLTFLVRKKIKK